jgi:hypothetical protein
VQRWAMILNGIVASSQVRDQFALVPRWRSMPASEARQWFKANGPLYAVVHAPVMTAAVLAELKSFATIPSGRRSVLAWVAFLGTAIHASITLAVHVPINLRFLAGRQSDEETEDLLRRWARWHAVRTGAISVAELAAVLRGCGFGETRR